MENPSEKDKALFAELIREKLGLFRTAAFHIVNSSQDADDVVQAALLKAWNKRGAFQSHSNALPGWVLKIVISESYNFLRNQMREKRRRSIWLEQQETVNSDDEARVMENLDHALSILPPIYREAIHTGVLSGLSGEEAAKLLDCTPNTLYQRIHKAKKLLSDAMRRLGYE